jgi:integrase
MPTMKLTDAAVRALAAPASGQTLVWDALVPRFALRLAAGGAQTWLVKYRVNGRARWLTLGTFPLLSLADARAKAKAALVQVAQGVDPAAEKQTAREAITVRELAALYIEKHARPKKRSWKRDEQNLKKYLPKAWANTPAKDITRRQVRELLDSIAERAPVQANRLLALLRKLWNFGIDRELVDANSCTRIARPGVEHQRDRVLSAEELRRLWAVLDTTEEHAQAAAILKLMLWTVARGGEVKSMRWEDVDLDGGWWTVPASVSKNKLAHRVPLTPPALALLRELQQGDESPWVFPSDSATGHRGNIAKATADIRQGCGIDFVPHDLRRTVTTFLTGELNVPRLVVSKLLNHVEPGVTKVYDRASYDREKQAALNSWAVKLEQIVSGESARAKVVPLRAS